MIKNDSKSKRLGAQLSRTVTVARNLPGPGAAVGVQLNAPPLVIDTPAAMLTVSSLVNSVRNRGPELIEELVA